MLYIIIVAVALVAILLFNCLALSMGIVNALFDIGIVLIGVCAVDVLLAWMIHSIPEKKINPFKDKYAMYSWEKKLYKILKIRLWKDKIPETGGKLCNFAKDKVYNMEDNAYVLKFLRETCYAEIMHFYSAFLGFWVLLAVPYVWTIALPIAVVNAFLQILPVMVQRYNRARLILLYRRNEKNTKLKEEKYEFEAVGEDVVQHNA